VLVIAICFNEDANAQEKISNSLEIGQVDIAKHDVVFLAGGWGAAWDLETSDSLGEQWKQADSRGLPSPGRLSVRRWSPMGPAWPSSKRRSATRSGDNRPKKFRSSSTLKGVSGAVRILLFGTVVGSGVAIKFQDACFSSSQFPYFHSAKAHLGCTWRIDFG
jgi:hypothetical protein